MEEKEFVHFKPTDKGEINISWQCDDEHFIPMCFTYFALSIMQQSTLSKDDLIKMIETCEDLCGDSNGE